MRRFEGYQKGINLGGWISQYAKYDKAHFDSFITEKDIDYIASLGFDHVRVPVDYMVLEEEDGTFKEDGFDYLDNCRKWCSKNKLNMLIDLHEAYGYTFDPLRKDFDREKFFYDEEMQGRFFRLWTKIATMFAPFADMVAVEPLNEVVSANVKDAWNKIATKYIELIRSISDKFYIVLGGVCYNNVLSIPLLDVPMDDRIVFNFHCYEPLIFTHQGAYWVENMAPDFRIAYPCTLEEYREASKFLAADHGGAVYDEGISGIGEQFFEDIFAPAIKYANEKNAAVYCGEYGVIDLANNEDKLRWLKDIHSVMKKYGIGRALWNYKEKDFGLVDDKFREIKDAFIEIL
ncbi:MAG: cellulase family glycosylhydrolase [Lachnospiraceae bacterium]|nr:cellulase family glycosylhydrolase [Candidatus Merdinaster equi]